jgi:glycerol-3-phosphate acyltransferase PlsY
MMTLFCFSRILYFFLFRIKSLCSFLSTTACVHVATVLLSELHCKLTRCYIAYLIMLESTVKHKEKVERKLKAESNTSAEIK